MAGCLKTQPSPPLPPKKHEIEYEQVITVLKPIDGVSVAVTYQGGVFYRVQVKNLTSSSITLSWDRSTYVTTSGQSIRLLRILDRGSLPPQTGFPQADSPIAPGSRLAANFIGESWVRLAQQGITPKPWDGLKRARIYLVFNVKNKQVEWQGEVVFVLKK